MENRAGGASFCDLGVLPVTIRVSSRYCGEITMTDVGVRFGETTTIKINTLCSSDGREFLPMPWCRVLLRFKDEEDKWISGIALKPSPPARDFRDIDPRYRANPFPRSDNAGRVLVTIPIELKGEFRAIATHDDYMPQPIQFPCTTVTYYTERVVLMHKTSK
jgi:hypothetical protein